MTANEVLDLARSQIGVCEIPKGSNRGTPYHAWFGSECQGWQWCAIYVSWVMRRVKGAIKSAYSGDWLAWGRRHGREIAIGDVLPGDIVIFDYGDGGITDHIGIVEERLGPITFQTLEGNINDCVGRRKRTASDTCLMWFVRPYYEEKPKEEKEMALTSLQATIGKGKSWKTASFGSPTSKVYVDAINDSTKPATWRVVIQLANGDYGDTANMDPPLQPIPPSTPRQAGFRTYELGALFNNGNLGNFSATFSADREMTIKITQEIR